MNEASLLAIIAEQDQRIAEQEALLLRCHTLLDQSRFPTEEQLKDCVQLIIEVEDHINRNGGHL